MNATMINNDSFRLTLKDKDTITSKDLNKTPSMPFRRI
jgi:hypothetical protein